MLGVFDFSASFPELRSFGATTSPSDTNPGLVVAAAMSVTSELASAETNLLSQRATRPSGRPPLHDKQEACSSMFIPLRRSTLEAPVSRSIWPARCVPCRGRFLGRRSRLSISHQVGGLISGFSCLHVAKVGPLPPSACDHVKGEREVNPKVVCFFCPGGRSFARSG